MLLVHGYNGRVTRVGCEIVSRREPALQRRVRLKRGHLELGGEGLVGQCVACCRP